MLSFIWNVSAPSIKLEAQDIDSSKRGSWQKGKKRKKSSRDATAPRHPLTGIYMNQNVDIYNRGATLGENPGQVREKNGESVKIRSYSKRINGETTKPYISASNVADCLSYCIFCMENYSSFLEKFGEITYLLKGYFVKISNLDIRSVSFCKFE